MRTSNEPDDPVAYDKTLYERGGGTNVLHLDTSVAFESPERLEELGIAPDKPSPAALRDSARRLRALGRSLIIYAIDHDDTFPDTVDDLQSGTTPDPAQGSMEQLLAELYGQRYPERMDARQLAWCREHVLYLGQGVKANDDPAGVLAYDKTLLAEGKGTNVLYVDAQVEFVSPEQFAARVSQATDYARVSVEEGVGLDGIVIGHTQAEFIKSKLGEPDQERNSEETGWWLDYRHRYGLQFRLNRQTGSLVEIQIGNGFKGSLRSGISMSSTMNEVFGAYGKPREVKTVGTSLTKHSASQILYQRMDLLGRLAAAKIHYQQHGLAFWFGPEKIHQIIVHEAGVPEQSIVPPATSAPSAEARAESAMRLSDLGKAVLFYAVDHEGKLPEGLIDIRPQFGVGFSWLYDHVEYLGRGMTTHDNPECPIAYDKTLFLEGNGTNVLYLNSRVVFETPERLKVLGIIADIDARTQAVEKLKALSEQLRSYAADHDGKLPDALSQLKGYTDDAALAWLLANVIYIGQERALSDPDRIIIAYDRTLLQQGQGTVVLYLGGNLVFEDARRLEHLGIRPGRCDYDVERAIAEENLPRLAMRAVSFALDFNDGILPKTLPELKATRMNPDEAFWAWVFDHAVYIAGGADVKDGAHHHTMPIAYSPLTSGQPDRFAVVFADCHVEMVNQARLTELGVKPYEQLLGSNKNLNVTKVQEAQQKLEMLGKVLMDYGREHGEALPNTLEGIRGLVRDGDFQWLAEHVEYVGRGRTLSCPFDTLIAYDKTMLKEADATVALCFGEHACFAMLRPRDQLDIDGAFEAASQRDAKVRVVSATRLSNLGQALLLYARDHDRRLPDELAEVQTYDRAGFSWLSENVAYVGKGLTTRNWPEQIVAYDKALLLIGAGTNTLSIGGEVVFENPQRLERLGVVPLPQSEDDATYRANLHTRGAVLGNLRHFKIIARTYAAENGLVYADNLDQLAPYLAERSENLRDWVRDHVEYLGKGARLTKAPPGHMPFAYCRPPSDASDEIAVVFWDGRTDFVQRSELEAMSIKLQR